MFQRNATHGVLAAAVVALASTAGADDIPAAVLDPQLQVTTVLSAGLTQPIGIVFLFSQTEKRTRLAS